MWWPWAHTRNSAHLLHPASRTAASWAARGHLISPNWFSHLQNASDRMDQLTKLLSRLMTFLTCKHFMDVNSWPYFRCWKADFLTSTQRTRPKDAEQGLAFDHRSLPWTYCSHQELFTRRTAIPLPSAPSRGYCQSPSTLLYQQETLRIRARQATGSSSVPGHPPSP